MSADVLYLWDIIGTEAEDEENGVATMAIEAKAEEDSKRLRRVDMARKVAVLRPMIVIDTIVGVGSCYGELE